MRGLGDATGNIWREGAALGGHGVSRLRSTVSAEDPRDGGHIGGGRRYRRRRHRCSHGFSGRGRSLRFGGSRRRPESARFVVERRGTDGWAWITREPHMTCCRTRPRSFPAFFELSIEVLGFAHCEPRTKWWVGSQQSALPIGQTRAHAKRVSDVFWARTEILDFDFEIGFDSMEIKIKIKWFWNRNRNRWFQCTDKFLFFKQL